MSDISSDVERRLNEGLAALESLKQARRKGSLSRLIGTACGLVIVGIFVYLFLSPIVHLKNNPEELQAAATAEVESRGLADELKGTVQRVIDQARPMYETVVKEELQKADLQGLLRQELQVAFDEGGVGDAYKRALMDAAEEIGLVEEAKKHAQNVFEQLQPYLMETVLEKVKALKLEQVVLEKAKANARDIVAVYRPLIAEELRNSGLGAVARDTLQQLVDDVVPVYSAEFEKARPDLQAALDEHRTAFIDEMREVVQEEVTAALREELAEMQTTLQQEFNLSDEGVETFVQDLLEAMRSAARGMMEKRAETVRVVLTDVLEMLKGIPVLEGWNRQDLIDETVRATLGLLKEHLPEYQIESE